MKLFVLYGQRQCRYPGEYALEALACMDEWGQSENPDYLDEKKAEFEKSDEFDRLAIVEVSLSEKDVRSILYPESKAIQATVTGPAGESA